MTAFQLKKTNWDYCSFTWNGMFWTFQNNSRSCSIHHYVKTNVKWKTNLRVIRATYIWLTGKKDAKQQLGEIMGFTEEQKDDDDHLYLIIQQRSSIICHRLIFFCLFGLARKKQSVIIIHRSFVRSLASKNLFRAEKIVSNFNHI